jgi:hypothetical protein
MYGCILAMSGSYSSRSRRFSGRVFLFDLPALFWPPFLSRPSAVSQLGVETEWLSVAFSCYPIPAPLVVVARSPPHFFCLTSRKSFSESLSGTRTRWGSCLGRFLGSGIMVCSMMLAIFSISRKREERVLVVVPRLSRERKAFKVSDHRIWGLSQVAPMC